MKTIGITGGIGSGKSIISKLFETMGVPVYITDIEAGKLNNSSSEIRKKLSDRFGSELYSGGTLNNKMLASLIFKDPDHLAFVNSVVHPEVYKNLLEWKKKYSKKEFIGVESAILFESGFNKYVDITLAVLAPIKVRIRRVQERDHLEEDAVLSRIQNQMSDKERIGLVNYAIINDGARAVLPQVENLFEMLKFREFI
jgi:dephospho-CoA kinase